MKRVIITVLTVLAVSGCATIPHASAISRLNEQIEDFNQEPRALEKIDSRVAHLEFDEVKRQIVCTDKHGKNILILEEQPDGHFKGRLQSETVAPAEAEGEGQWFLSRDVELEKGEFQPEAGGYRR